MAIYSDILTVGTVCKDRNNNPWLDRLHASFEKVPSGLPVPVQFIVEDGSYLTKVEKKIRVMAQCRTRYLLMMEDDTEFITPGWGMGFLNSAQAYPNVGIVAPAEIGFGVYPEDAIRKISYFIQEITNSGGFCQFLDLSTQIRSDVRFQTVDDLYLSLKMRSFGRRILMTSAVVVRHTKEPWASGQNQDPRRAAKEHYTKADHQTKRLAECQILLNEFGDMARQTIPPELLSVLEPQGIQTGLTSLAPGCSDCRRVLSLEEDFVMYEAAVSLCVDCWKKRRGV